MVLLARALVGAGRELRVTLTDRFPSDAARKLLGVSEEHGIHYESAPVDATEVSEKRPGLRTLFNAFHHFRPELATHILSSAVDARRPIVVVEVLQRSPLSLLGMLMAPLVALVAVPFLRPFRPAWLLFSYAIPIIPLFILWDGIISTLRAYDQKELLDLAQRADPERAAHFRPRGVELTLAGGVEP